jgi:hypothetical protein
VSKQAERILNRACAGLIRQDAVAISATSIPDHFDRRIHRVPVLRDVVGIQHEHVRCAGTSYAQVSRGGVQRLFRRPTRHMRAPRFANSRITAAAIAEVAPMTRTRS